MHMEPTSSAEDAGVYSVSVRGRAQIAHSFKGELFGAAQTLHGCTYVVDAVCRGVQLQAGANYLVDICAAESALKAALARYDRRNLDDLAEFAGDNTTCERVARAVWERVAAALPRPPALASLQIVVRESDVARVEYERSLGASDGGLYSVCVRARFMAARTLAGGVEGSTFVVDALFSGRELDPRATFLFDICLAEELLQRAVAHLHQTHLDEQLPHLFGAGKPPPTAGAIARVIWEAVAEGLPPEHRLAGLKVLVREHDEAAAEYSRPLAPADGDSCGGDNCGGGTGAVPSRGEGTVVRRGRCMIAHSFRGEAFGPAQALHGCTYVVDARYSCGGSEAAAGGPFSAPPHGSSPLPAEAPELLLRRALAAYHQRNLDELAEFEGENTTCERVARGLWSRVAAALPPRSGTAALEVVVRESDVAWVSFRRALPPTSTGAPRPAAIALDLDSLLAAAPDASPDAASGRAAVEEAGAGSPTGIVHRSPLAALVAAMPTPLVAWTALPREEAGEALARCCGLSAAAHNVAFRRADEAIGEGAGEAMDAATPHSCGAVSAAPPYVVITASEATRAKLPPHAGASLPLLGRGCAADRALLAALGCTSPRTDDAQQRVAYLTAKRPVDRAAYSGAVLAALQEALAARLASCRAGAAAAGGGARTPPLRVFDVGAGTLSMFPVVRRAAERAGWGAMHYCAFDTDDALLAAARREPGHADALSAASGGGGGGGGGGELVARLELHCADVRALEAQVGVGEGGLAPCDLLVGSGFADLFAPAQLTSLLARLCPGASARRPRPAPRVVSRPAAAQAGSPTCRSPSPAPPASSPPRAARAACHPTRACEGLPRERRGCAPLTAARAE